LPTITSLGPYHTRTVPGMRRTYAERNVPMEVSQEWLDAYRNRLSPKWWKVEGDAGITVDAGNDGLPDSGWTKKDITGWLKDKGVSITGYATKAKLLDKVKTTLNPPAPEPVVEEVAPEPVAEEVVEDTIVEDPIVETDGVEE